MADDRHTPWWRDAVVYQVYVRSFADGRTGLAAAFSAESILQVFLNVEKQRDGKAKA